jgi:DNA repair ATPase RecN
MAGVEWKPVKVAGLSKEMQALHKSYVELNEKAKKEATKLKDQLRDEWNKKFPNGVDGKVAAFNITGGKLQYVMKDKDSERDMGDDVFSNP